jgi:hypothetical protein
MMRNIYRLFLNRVGTDQALVLAHDLEHWHGRMQVHRDEIMRLGFAPDGHSRWEDCPHAEARQLWARAVQVLGSRAGELEFLRACSLPPPPDRPETVVRRPWAVEHLGRAA